MLTSSMTDQRVLLNFAGRQVEVPVADESGIAQLQHEAQTVFGVQQDTYSFFDACGKIEGDDALRRAMLMSADRGDGPFSLEVRERAEWQKMRYLEARIDTLAAQAGPGLSEWAIQQLEERVMSKTNDVITEAMECFRRTEAKVDQVIAPLLENLAVAQMDTKATLDGLSTAALEHRMDAIETRLTTSLAKMASRKESTPVSACKLDLEHSPASQGCTPMRSVFTQADLGTSEPSPSPKRSPKHHRADRFQDYASPKQFRVTSDGRVQLREGGKGEKLGLKDWQNAAAMLDEWSGGDALAAVPFARQLGTVAGRGLERKPGSRSMPLLPPLF